MKPDRRKNSAQAAAETVAVAVVDTVAVEIAVVVVETEAAATRISQIIYFNLKEQKAAPHKPSALFFLLSHHPEAKN